MRDHRPPLVPRQKYSPTQGPAQPFDLGLGTGCQVRIDTNAGSRTVEGLTEDRQAGEAYPGCSARASRVSEAGVTVWRTTAGATRETRMRQRTGEGCFVRTPDGLDELRWRWMLLRRPRTDRFFLLHAATRPAGFQDVRVYGRDGISEARLVWKVCHECNRGVISKISLSPEVQRQGLGTLLINRALLDGPGYRWTTSSQSPDGRAFFQTMSARTGAEFTAGARTCEHILESQPGHHKPILDRLLHSYAAGAAR